jgi:hypothetical protein
VAETVPVGVATIVGVSLGATGVAEGTALGSGARVGVSVRGVGDAMLAEGESVATGVKLEIGVDDIAAADGDAAADSVGDAVGPEAAKVSAGLANWSTSARSSRLELSRWTWIWWRCPQRYLMAPLLGQPRPFFGDE